MKKLNNKYLKTKTGFFNHLNIEIRNGDILQQSEGTKRYLVYNLLGNSILINDELPDTPMFFYFDNNDNDFSIVDNIFDNESWFSYFFNNNY
tara:strand:- start:238 stop:513 length:276 start_codon:yes stop_codon:yes gene_type:complete